MASFGRNGAPAEQRQLHAERFAKAVSSDLILLMRYHRAPGAETGRPLRTTADGFWKIDDDYPAPPKKAPAEQ